MEYKNKQYEEIEKSEWKGYNRYDFFVDGREAIVIEPKEAAEGRPWIWRTEFFDAFSQADMAMVDKGWHLAYYKIQDMYGCPQAVELMRNFHMYVVKKFSLKNKVVQFGFSRGGLYAFNYTAKYSEDIAALYLDAPVMDVKSWPAGKGIGEGAPKEWNECKELYGITEEKLDDFKGSPLDKVEIVAEAKIPIIIVAGDSDRVVPYCENGQKLVKRYKELGGLIKEIVKAGCDHHPHSLDNPEPIVNFILENAKRI
ncbi:alpha/beta hydrolase family protein [Clostridium oryzae]|uniref:Alpha/beta hydrolase family protein n=1 Tax=Clostridium oryzae TaxID=1450648 RepID=A0A1V4IVL5_9CLOT|nr:alpha/beta hydrolase [Clostridium oryzae]OPJ63933.1 alpha/beta hydrolase family protein [Clostridium oryzae]